MRTLGICPHLRVIFMTLSGGGFPHVVGWKNVHVMRKVLWWYKALCRFVNINRLIGMTFSFQHSRLTGYKFKIQPEDFRKTVTLGTSESEWYQLDIIKLLQLQPDGKHVGGIEMYFFMTGFNTRVCGCQTTVFRNTQPTVLVKVWLKHERIRLQCLS